MCKEDPEIMYVLQGLVIDLMILIC